MKNKYDLDHAELLRCLHYDPDSGVFTWLESRSHVRAGSVAGRTEKDGYIRIQIFGKLYLAHRLAWMYMHGEFPKDQLDHINQAKADNRIANLREVDCSENMKNQKMRVTNTSGFIGVSWFAREKIWVVFIGVNGKQKYIGRYKSKLAAILHRKRAEIEHGYHQNHGQSIGA